MPDNVIPLKKEDPYEYTETCVDFAAEAAIEDGMTLNQFVKMCVSYYQTYKRRMKNA